MANRHKLIILKVGAKLVEEPQDLLKALFVVFDLFSERMLFAVEFMGINAIGRFADLFYEAGGQALPVFQINKLILD